MRKCTLLVAAIAALLPVGLASPASADILDGTKLPGTPVAAGAPHTDDVTRVCDYPGSIFIRDVKNGRTTTVTNNPDGSTTTVNEGPLTQSLTHASKEVKVDDGGTSTEILSTDGAKLTFDSPSGGNLFILGPGGRKNTGLPAILYTVGPVHVEVSINLATKVGTVQSLTGGPTTTFTDMCAALAK
jgi:hypothetical protein